jgi:DNA polymerase-1
MLLQAHDELLFEVPSENRRPVEELVRHEMEYVRVLDVPLRVEIGWGANWTEAHA